MLVGKCYCEAISVEIPRRPGHFTDCNCSICRKYGALWAYFQKKTIRISRSANSAILYTVEKNKGRMRVARCASCASCGCITHYDWGEIQPIDKMMAVNGRMFDLSLLESIPVKKLHGARHWDHKKETPVYPFQDPPQTR